MNKIVIAFFYLFTLSPVLAIFFYKHITYYWACGALFAILSLGYLIIYKRLNFRVPNYIICFSLAFIYYLVWAIYQGFQVQGGLIQFLYKNHLFTTIFILLLIENMRFNERTINNFILIFKVTLVVATCVTLIQVFINPDFFMPIGDLNYYGAGVSEQFGKTRFLSIFAYTHLHDSGMSYLSIASIIMAISFRKGVTPYIWIFLMLIYVVMSGARWIMLCYLVSLLFLFKTYKGIKSLRYVVLSFVILIIALYLLQVLGFDLTRFFKERIMEESYKSRIMAIGWFKENFPQNPFFGTGERVTKSLAKEIAGESSQIHIGYLSHLYEFGIIGSSFLFAAWFLILRDYYTTAKQSGYYGSFLGFLSFVIANFTLPQYSIFFYGLIFTFIFNRYYKIKIKSIVNEYYRTNIPSKRISGKSPGSYRYWRKWVIN
jgi:hypothetical protein